MTTLILSPHFDDAFLSAFALLDGQNAGICYPFGRSTPRSRRWRQEELPNIRAIGCATEFLECVPPRLTGRWNGKSVQSGEMARAESDLRDALIERYRSQPVGTIAVPLAIGLHPEHVVCTRAVLAAAAGGAIPVASILFYTDLPYAVALPLLRGSALQLWPHMWLVPSIRRAPVARKARALERYRSQYSPGVMRHMLRYTTQSAVSMRRPLDRAGPGGYECFWTIPGPASAAAAAAACTWQPPASLERFQRRYLPEAADDVPFFDPQYREQEQKWAHVIEMNRPAAFLIASS